MSADTEPGTPSASAAGRIAGLIAANATLVVGVLVYMGWAWDSAFLGYFHLSPLDLGVGVSEYILRSLDLFSPVLVIIAVLVVVTTATRPWAAAGTWVTERVTRLTPPAARRTESAGLPDTVNAPETPDVLVWTSVPRGRFIILVQRLVSADEDSRRKAARLLLIRSGLVITAAGLLLAWLANYTHICTYLVLGLLIAGPLMLTRPGRAAVRGRFPYALAVVVAAVCALWATSLYAEGVGRRDAQAVVHNLASGTAVALYSADRLGLNRLGITDTPLPPGAQYHFEYTGLRLLMDRGGTYYLLPVGWSPGADDTITIDDSDTIRVVLYSGVTRPGG